MLTKLSLGEDALLFTALDKASTLLRRYRLFYVGSRMSQMQAPKPENGGNWVRAKIAIVRRDWLQTVNAEMSRYIF